jgi:hypothetical protein
MNLRLALALCVCVVPCVSRAATGVRTPTVLREGQVDTTSVETIIADIIKPGMTQRQKAEAVYEFYRKMVFHAPPAREGRKPYDFSYGVVYDPIRLINVYGYTYCFGNRAGLHALWQAAGLQARSAGIGGHSIAEVFYDGAFHFYDADQQGYCLLPDGKTVASIAQVENDPIGLFLKQKNPSKPYFPAVSDPKVPYESAVITASYFASKGGGNNVNYYKYDHVVLRHRMGITLLPGMRLVRGFHGEGKWNYRPKTVANEAKVGYIDLLKGPECYVSDRTYGNGHLLWQPDLRKSTGEYAAGVWEETNIVQDEKGLTPKDAGKAAWAVFRVNLPYVIVGQPTSWVSPPKPVGAAVVAATFSRKSADDAQAISMSVDNGRTWTPVWTNEKTGTERVVVDLSAYVAHRYEYMVRLELSAKDKPADSRLSQLSMRTSFQVAPTSLPALKPGANKMTFKLGDQTETEIINPDLTDKAAFLRGVHKVSGVWFQKGQIKGKYRKTGEIIYELKPPKPGTLVHVGGGAGCRREPFGFHPGDDIKIWYAEGEPKDWKLIYDDDVPPWMRHWSYHANGRAVCSPGTKKAYIKFAIKTGSTQSIQRLWLRMNWRPDGAGGMPKRGVKVTHTWGTGDVDMMHIEESSHVITQAPSQYTVTARHTDEFHNVSVAIEPVRDPKCTWRKGDPAMKRPKVEPPTILDPKVRDEWRMLLRNIDKDPKKWLPVAAKNKSGWLAGGAKQAITMYRMRLPVKARPRAAPPKLDAAQTAELVKAVDTMPPVMVLDKIVTLLVSGHKLGAEKAAIIMAGPNPYLKLRVLGMVGRYAIKPVPDALLPGLKAESRWVRLTVLGMARRAPSKTALKAVEQMSKNDPLEWLREEAKSVLRSSG